MSDTVDYPAVFGQETWQEALEAALSADRQGWDPGTALLDSLLAAGALHLEHRVVDQDGTLCSLLTFPTPEAALDDIESLGWDERFLPLKVEQRLVSRWQHT